MDLELRLPWEADEMRRVFILLASNALPYARHCIDTMLSNSVEPIRLHLVTDNVAEQTLIADAMANGALPGGSTIEVLHKEQVSDQLSSKFPGRAGLRALHDGHPCWRKIIDPLVLSEPGDEIIVADPDLIFPNRYAFEPTPATGILLMRQGPNCLFPPQAVRSAFDLGVRLIDHVDIGVAQLRPEAIDIEWLDWLALRLDLARFRPFMHIEAIIWAAMAMQFGGRHLSPASWRCWERGKVKRLLVAAGMPGRWTLKLEPWGQVKCIHVSGPSKWWVSEAISKGGLLGKPSDRIEPSAGPAFVELRRDAYEAQQSLKDVAKRLGYYRLSSAGR